MIKRSENSGLSLARVRAMLPSGSGGGEKAPKSGRSSSVPLRFRRLVQPGLQTRFLATVALLMLCMVTVLVAVTVQYQRSTLRDDLERRVEVLAELVASQPLIQQADPTGDGLQDVADFLAEQPDIDFALLLTPDNEVLIDASGSGELVGQTVVDESGVVNAAVAGIEADGTAEPAIREYEGAIHVAQPIVVRGQHVRTVDFAVSLNDVNSKSTSLLIRGLLLGFGFLVIGVLATALLVRRITRPLTQLTEAAEDMSRAQIPALVEQLRSGDVSTSVPEVELIEVHSDDEIGRLGAAFNSIQLTTAEVARSQGELLKRGISDIFVQLARRNQSLIDRQLEVIDDLEASERSPDALAGLFKLDHLAARMRRNAESLLVLADEGSTNVRARPVSMTDMVRVAIGEVEQYHRVEVLGIDDAMVKGAAASGMSHLLAELLDNALRNSPEASRVDVTGSKQGEGYRIEVSDQGVGLSAEQLREYNELLQQPPEMGLTLSRSLGFTVVSRLARQFDLRVSLRASEAGGVTASVEIPAAMVGSSSPGGSAVAPSSVPVAQPVPAAPTPAPVAGPLPEPPSFDAGAGLPDGVEPLPAVSATPVPDVAESLPEPPSFDGGSGLPVRGAEPVGVPPEALPEPPSFDGGSGLPVRGAEPVGVPPEALPEPPSFDGGSGLPVRGAEPVGVPPEALPEPLILEASLPDPWSPPAGQADAITPDGQVGSPPPPPPEAQSDSPPPPPPEGLSESGPEAGGIELPSRRPSVPVDETLSGALTPPPPPEGLSESGPEAGGIELPSRRPSVPVDETLSGALTPPPPPEGLSESGPEAGGIELPSRRPSVPVDETLSGALSPLPIDETLAGALTPPSPGGLAPLPTRRPGPAPAAPRPSADGPGFPAAESGLPAAAEPATMTGIAQRQAPQARSPEQLRQMLNNYRRGQARSRQSENTPGVTDDGPAQ